MVNVALVRELSSIKMKLLYVAKRQILKTAQDVMLRERGKRVDNQASNFVPEISSIHYFIPAPKFLGST